MGCAASRVAEDARVGAPADTHASEEDEPDATPPPADAEDVVLEDDDDDDADDDDAGLPTARISIPVEPAAPTGLGFGMAAKLIMAFTPSRAAADADAEGMHRYVGTEVLRRLLSHDAELGGTPIVLVRARWLLEEFGRLGSTAVLSTRQQLARQSPDAFADGAMVEALLREVEASCTSEGGYMAFPGVVACSYCWLSQAHPDPEGRTVREIWLPALEWYLSERLVYLQQNDPTMIDRSEEEKLAACDFGVFIDYVSMMQRDAGGAAGAGGEPGGEPGRTATEQALFERALGSLDAVYAHRGAATFLTTALPSGSGEQRQYAVRGWPTFERSESELVKPSGHALDLGGFSLERVAEACECKPFGVLGEWADGPGYLKSCYKLAKQASYVSPGTPGALGALVGGTRRPPVHPDAFDRRMGTLQFTNGADRETVKALYRKTAATILASTPQLDYSRLNWQADDWAMLGDVLPLCSSLETIRMGRMQGAPSPFPGAFPPRVVTIDLSCRMIESLPSLRACAGLVTLDLSGCDSLLVLPELAGCAALEALELARCRSLPALPSLGTNAALRSLGLAACTSLERVPPLSACAALRSLDLNGCSALLALPALDGSALAVRGASERRPRPGWQHSPLELAPRVAGGGARRAAKASGVGGGRAARVRPGQRRGRGRARVLCYLAAGHACHRAARLAGRRHGGGRAAGAAAARPALLPAAPGAARHERGHGAQQRGGDRLHGAGGHARPGGWDLDHVRMEGQGRSPPAGGARQGGRAKAAGRVVGLPLPSGAGGAPGRGGRGGALRVVSRIADA